MLPKLILLALVFTRMKDLGGGRTEWIYRHGPNKGYLCALMQPDGTGYDIYVPAANLTPDADAAVNEVPWTFVPSAKVALDTIQLYCPVKAEDSETQE